MKEKVINGYRHVKKDVREFTDEELLRKSKAFYQEMDTRRSIRVFSDRAVPKAVIQNIIKTAGTAPSGAHKQPWTFCAVSNPDLKAKIRAAAETEERINYDRRMSKRWKEDLLPLATNWQKEFLTTAPWLIAVFKQSYGFDILGEKDTHYYVNESVGIACGMLITAIHQAGLVTLTHTPSPMNFLAEVLQRPENERAFLLLPVGYPETPCFVPDLQRKPLDEIAEFY